MHVSHRDLNTLLSAVGILGADCEPDTLPARTDSAVRYIISTDVVSFEGFGIDNDYQGPLWYTPSGTVSQEKLEVIGELVTEHPIFEDMMERRVRDAVRVSDYMPTSKFKRTALYNEFFRDLGTDQQLVAGLAMNEGFLITVSLCRLRKVFSDRDCRVFNLLTPHLVAAFRNAQFINRIKFEGEQMQLALESAKCGIITLDGDLKPQKASPAAIDFLGKYFQSYAGLPDELIRYLGHHMPRLRGREFYLPPEPFEIRLKNSKLRVRIVFDSTSVTTIIFLEEIALHNLASLANIGLTAREQTVLSWISQGKTDGEIGLLLEISVRTVQKHVENIFNKLGVETRTAAAMAMIGP